MKTPPRSVLVIVTRRIGDALLATPLLRSLKRAWPDAALDMLVFEGTQGVIAANPDVRQVLIVPERPRLLQHLALILRLARRYDVALSVLPGDRPTLYAFLAGRWRAGPLAPGRKEAWKRRLLNRSVPFDNLNTHTVLMNLALSGVLGIAPCPEVTVSWSAEDVRRLEALLGPGRAQPIAVLHPYPKFNYKMWRHEGWTEVARWLVARGYRVVLSGGHEAAEVAYVGELARAMPGDTLNLAGKLTLGSVGSLLSRASLCVGPDTVVTHMAAAIGVPTIALYGPTNPVKWGPWPRNHGCDAGPWRRCGSQRAGNVALLQGVGACVPCTLEGCERNIASFSDCLQGLPAAKVIAAIEDVISNG